MASHTARVFSSLLPVLYIPDNYPNVCAVNLSTNLPVCAPGINRRPIDFCTNHRIEGLDIARAVLGLGHCPGLQVPSDMVINNATVQLVLLVDDGGNHARRQLQNFMPVTEGNYIVPTFSNFRRHDNVVINSMLVVGSSLYLKGNTRGGRYTIEQWVARIRQAIDGQIRLGNTVVRAGIGNAAHSSSIRYDPDRNIYLFSDGAMIRATGPSGRRGTIVDNGSIRYSDGTIVRHDFTDHTTKIVHVNGSTELVFPDRTHLTHNPTTGLTTVRYANGTTKEYRNNTESQGPSEGQSSVQSERTSTNKHQSISPLEIEHSRNSASHEDLVRQEETIDVGFENNWDTFSKRVANSIKRWMVTSRAYNFAADSQELRNIFQDIRAHPDNYIVYHAANLVSISVVIMRNAQTRRVKEVHFKHF